MEARSTKAGAETPATLQLIQRRVRQYTTAQQRPEPKLRRHISIRLSADESVVAQQRPEPKLRRHTNVADDGNARADAQQRPEPKLRRHFNLLQGLLGRTFRSTKAGAETPATRRCRGSGAVPASRSTKAGAETPATPAEYASVPWTGCVAQQRPEPKLRRHSIPRVARSRGASPLNKGRSRNSGDTWVSDFTGAHLYAAQQRPEPKLRRHSGGWRRARACSLRSTKAGAETPATQPCGC